MKKTSFIKKLFLSLILLYLFVFVGMFIFQRVIFQRYYQNKVIRTTIAEINETFDTFDINNSEDQIVEFSQKTQTTAIIIPAQDLQNDINQLSLLVAEVETESGTKQIFIPNKFEFEDISGDEVMGMIYLHEPSGVYVPSSLIIDGTRVIHSRGGRISSIYRDILKDIDLDSRQSFNGTITSVSSQTTNTPLTVNPIISNEVLNILSENYDEIVRFDNGFYYQSIEEGSLGNMVFYSKQEVNGNYFILIAVYPLSHIDSIIRAMQLVNIYIFIAVLTILILASLFYTRRFTIPFNKLRLATQKLSNLDFKTTIDMGNRNDEFTELAENIMILSKNLDTTLNRLNQQNHQLSESLKRENENEESRIQFIRGMSHELKTPLAVIQASSEALQKKVFTNSEVQKISSMINNMMHVYKLDNAQYRDSWSIFNLGDLFNDYFKNLEILITRNKLTLVSDIEDTNIFGDEEKIGMVISNLLTNAIKYTPPEGVIKVKIYTDNNLSYFSIENSDTHIDETHLEQLFEPFYRVDKARSRNDGNSGLGLYIVQQTLKQHDSECIVENTDNGVRFSFKIKSSD